MPIVVGIIHPPSSNLHALCIAMYTQIDVDLHPYLALGLVLHHLEDERADRTRGSIDDEGFALLGLQQMIACKYNAQTDGSEKSEIPTFVRIASLLHKNR